MAKPPIIDDENSDEPARYHPPGGSQAGGPVVSENIMSGMTDLEKAQASVLARMNRENVKLYERLAELEKSLEPFASAANAMEKVNDGRPLVPALWAGWSQREKTPLTVGDCRRARAALAKARGEA